MTHVALFGPMLSGHPGWVANQGEILAAKLGGSGYEVRVTSSRMYPLGRAADYVWDMVRWRRWIDVAIVMVFSGRAFLFADLATRQARSLSIPCILWLHGGNLPRFAGQRPRWVRQVLSRSPFRVAPSDFLRRELEPIAGDVRVIPNLLDLERLGFRQRHRLAPRVLWMRTFHRLNRPALAVETFAHLATAIPEARLTMAGQDRGLGDETRALVRKIGLENRTRFPGFLDESDKEREFDAHDLFLSTNEIDNAPVSVLEAAAHGLPVVASAVGGLPDLLPHGEGALLVKGSRPEDHAAALSRLLRDPELAARLSRQGRQRAELCDWQESGGRWLELLSTARRLGA